MNDKFNISTKYLNRKRIAPFLEQFQSNISNGVSIYSLPPASISEVENSLKHSTFLDYIPEQALAKMKKSDTGFALFINTGSDNAEHMLIIPPVPFNKNYFTETIDIKPFVHAIDIDYVIAIVLVRLGRYTLGVARGEELLTGKTGSGLVHGRHRQGGSSAKRFARHRQKQIEVFLNRICLHCKEQFSPYLGSIDYIIYGGAWTTISELKKHCSFLGDIKAYELPPVLDIPEPKQKVLLKLLEKTYTYQVFQWSKNDYTS